MDEVTEADVASDSLPGSEEGDLDIDLDLRSTLGNTAIKQEHHRDEEEDEEDRERKHKDEELEYEEEEEEGADEREEEEDSRETNSEAGGHKTGYQCKLCTVLLSSQGALDEHMNIHSGSRPYKCRECNFSCSLHNTLIQHLAVHSHQRTDMNSGQPWTEHLPLYNNHVAERHVEQHLPPLPTRMPLPENHTPTSLPFSTAVEQALMPSGLPSFPDQGKVFQCKLCTHISPTKTHLNEHMNVHTGKKPYKCLVCGFSSAFRSSLMRHLIVHTGTSKQFKCESCHYQTPYKCNLQAHRRKRHNSNSIDNLDMNYPPISSSNQPPLDQDSPPLQPHGKIFPSSEETTRYLMQSELTNSNHSAHHENSGMRRHSLSPDDHDSSASNDTHELSRFGSGPLSLVKAGDMNRYSGEGSIPPQSPEPPVLEKHTPLRESEPTDRPKSGDVVDYSSPVALSNSNIQEIMASTTQSTITMLSNAVSSASSVLGMPHGSNFVSSMTNSMTSSIRSTSPQHPLSEISVITPLQWAGAGFPIYRRKKEGGARKRKRTPVPKRNYLMSPNGEDMNNSWADTRPEISDYVRGSGGNDEPQNRQFCHVTQAYSLKTEDVVPYAIKTGGVNGMDLSVGCHRDVYGDIEPVSNSSVSPASQPADDQADERNHLHRSLSVTVDQSQGSLLSLGQSTRSTQTDALAPVSSGKLDGQSQTDQVDPASVPGNLLKCPHCETFFADHVIFTLHMSCHGTRHPFQCSICGYVCRDKIEFTCHITRSQHLR